MNKYQQEYLLSNLKDEKQALKDLKRGFQDALNDVNSKINELMKHPEMQSKIYQARYQEALKKQIEESLAKINDYETISDYLEKSYETGYIGVMYDLHKQDIPIITPIDQRQMSYAMFKETKLKDGLYGRLGYNKKVLAQEVNHEISRGVATALSYAEVARNITSRFNIGMNKGYLIARTEGHRVMTTGSFNAMSLAKEKGANIVKQWDATLDERTRESHASVDGEIKELDEPFSNGLMFPSDSSGPPEEVCNCRCALLERARWALDDDELEELEERAEYFYDKYGIDKSDKFDEFKRKYLNISSDDIIRVDKTAVYENTSKMRMAMDRTNYDSYINLVNKNESIANLYAKYGDKISGFEMRNSSGSFSPYNKYIKASYANYEGLNKYSTIAHEYGHAFDDLAEYTNLAHKELEMIKEKSSWLDRCFRNKDASNSDEFLKAVREDKAYLKDLILSSGKDERGYRYNLINELNKDHASNGVQDALSGMFNNELHTYWTHESSYYNRKYNELEPRYLDSAKGSKKLLKEVYQALGFDASNQSKVKAICRDYETASEMWANIASAVTTDGKELEYVKKYLPNSYEAFMKIIKGVK